MNALRVCLPSLLLTVAGYAQTTTPPTAAPTPVPAAQAERPLANDRRDSERFRTFFAPFRTDRAAISPDGRHLAFTYREGEELSVVIYDTDHLGTPKARVLVGDDRTSTPYMAIDQGERTPAQVNWLRWVTSDRVVVETNRIAIRAGLDSHANWRGAVLAFNADGSNARVLVTPHDTPEPEGAANFDRDFSVDRRDSRFNDRIVRVDQPLPTNEERDPLEAARRREMANDVATSPPNQPAQPRSLRVFNVDPARPGSILLMVSGNARSLGSYTHEFFTVDTGTGKLASLRNDVVPNNFASLIDWQGNVRLLAPTTTTAAFPHRYEYQGSRGQKSPVALNDYLGADRQDDFSFSPDNYFRTRSIPLGFDATGKTLYVASNHGRDTFGIYSLDLESRKRGSLTIENPVFDLIGPPESGFPGGDVLVFDPHTQQLVGVRYAGAFGTSAWLQPELAAAQTQLEKQFPGRTIDFVDWSRDFQRIVVRLQGPADPGGYYLFDRTRAKLIEFARRAPEVEAQHLHRSETFAVKLPDGTRLTGLVTLPTSPRVKHAPLVVLCPAQPWRRVSADYQAEVQALADMGFVVAQVNARGVWGFGQQYRESIKAGYDDAQIADITATVRALSASLPINTTRVALLGFEYGGYVALRAVQEHPELFKCAIAVNAPIEIDAWQRELYWSADGVQPALTRAWYGDETHLQRKPLLTPGRELKRPVLMLQYPGRDGGPRNRAFVTAKAFAATQRRAGSIAIFEEVPTDYYRGLPQARADVFGQMEQFLNEHIYDFSVRSGDLKPVEYLAPEQRR